MPMRVNAQSCDEDSDTCITIFLPDKLLIQRCWRDKEPSDRVRMKYSIAAIPVLDRDWEGIATKDV